MPGNPEPVLGSEVLTLGVAFAGAVLLVSLLYTFLEKLPAPIPFALGGGLSYAVICLGIWAGVRYVGDAFANFGSRASFAGWVLLGALVLGAQAAVALYLYAQQNLLTPLAGLVVLTTVVIFLFLRIGGETDPLALYALFIGPLMIGLLCVIALGEFGIKYMMATEVA